MNRIPLIAGNWKMFKTGSEAVSTAEKLANLTQNITSTDIMIAPTHLSLPLVTQKLLGTNVKVGAQNLYFEQEGAFTGEVSAEMIKDTGAEYVLIGHSERRQFFGETDESVFKKIKAATKVDLIPIMCIGESEKERNEKNTFAILDKQVKNGLKDFVSDDPDSLSSLVLAYEPIWAIGTGKTASVDQVDEIHKYLRSLISQLFSRDFALKIRILYGGSVKPDNVKELMAIEDVDGALVGGASLDPDKFIKIIGFSS
ncbi:MAG: triose-phosphate isomerase [Desulfobacterales bacterium]|nr:triose-phosphate isomerase [Desulfobacterales bacterium]